MQPVIKHKLTSTVTPKIVLENASVQQTRIQDSTINNDVFECCGVEECNNLKSATVEKNDKLDSFSPLLLTMRICGMYFTRKTDGTVFPDGKNRRLLGGVPEVYSVVLMIFIWINAIRFLMIFKPDDAVLLYMLIAKIALVTWTLHCAVQQTVFFYASRSGKLDKVLKGLQVSMPCCTQNLIHRHVTKFTVKCWIFMCCNILFQSYAICYLEQIGNMLMTPVGNYFSFSDLTYMKAIFIICFVFTQPSGILPVAMTLAMSIAFHHQFRNLARRLKAAIRKAPALEDAEVEAIRKEHQFLSRLVKQADQFLKVYYLSAFFCPMIMTILIVFALFFYYWVIKNEVVSLIAWLFWLFLNVSQMCLSVFGGIIVNSQAHKPREYIHNINLAGLNCETIGKINVFLNRVSTEPIGFTVCGVMPIDKNSIMALLGLMITYFLLLVQLTNPSVNGAVLPSNSSFNSTNATMS